MIYHFKRGDVVRREEAMEILRHSVTDIKELTMRWETFHMCNFKIIGVTPLDQYADYAVVYTKIGEDPVIVKITPTWTNGYICVSFKNGNSKLLDIGE